MGLMLGRKRRMAARAGQILLACGVMVSAQAQPLTRVEITGEAMGTTFSVVAFGQDGTRTEAAGRAALDEAQRLDRMLSNYRPDSEWSGMNRRAGAGPVQVSSELFDLLAACLAYSRATDGAFDVSVGPLMKVWGFYRDEGTLPRDAEVAAALGQVGYRHVVLNAGARTVQFDRRDVELDPGGIGKGYAVDRMAAVLRQRGVTAALISAGGSSIYGLGAPPGDPRGWKVTIRSPADPREAAAEVLLRDLSLSTSGSYEKFFRANGRIYAHIMDPRTGYPAQGTAAVSALAPRTIDTEAWTKPFFVNGREWTVAHRPGMMRVFFCGEGTPAMCEWIE